MLNDDHQFVGATVFERMSGSVRAVLQAAHRDARRHFHDCIDTGDLLLGLSQESSGWFARLAEELNLDIAKLRLRTEYVVPPGYVPTHDTKLPLTPRARRVLGFADDEARSQGRTIVGLPDLLLGLALEEEGVAAVVLSQFNVGLEVIRQTLQKSPNAAAPEQQVVAVQAAVLSRVDPSAEDLGKLIAFELEAPRDLQRSAFDNVHSLEFENQFLRSRLALTRMMLGFVMGMIVGLYDWPAGVLIWPLGGVLCGYFGNSFLGGVFGFAAGARLGLYLSDFKFVERFLIPPFFGSVIGTFLGDIWTAPIVTEVWKKGHHFRIEGWLNWLILITLVMVFFLGLLLILTRTRLIDLLFFAN